MDGFVNRYSCVLRFGKRGDKACNHYHKEKSEIFYALHGELRVVLQDIVTGEREELHLTAGDNRFIYVPSTVAHVVVSETDDDSLLVIASHPEASSDEFAYQVV